MAATVRDDERRAAAALAEARADVLRVLAAAYVVFPGGRGGDAESIVAVWQEVADAVPGPAALAVVHALRDLEGSEDALRRDHEALFVTSTGRYVAPFESAHGTRSMKKRRPFGRLRGPRWRAFRERYAAYGFALVSAQIELDHIGAELSFQATLCDAEAAAWLAGDDDAVETARADQARFLDEHLLSWLPALHEQIKAAAESAFYPAVSALSLAFLHTEREHLEAAEDAP